MEHLIHHHSHHHLNTSASAAANNGGTRGDHHRNQILQREAALDKFRLKRKRRCFMKKIRYPRMKILADRRQRVQGQFARENAFKSADQPPKIIAGNNELSGSDANISNTRLEVGMQTNQVNCELFELDLIKNI